MPAAAAAGGDAYACAVAHREGENVVLDAVRGRAGRLDPAKVTREYAELAKQYGVGGVSGDHYAGEWVGGAGGSAASFTSGSSRQDLKFI